MIQFYLNHIIHSFCIEILCVWRKTIIIFLVVIVVLIVSCIRWLNVEIKIKMMLTSSSPLFLTTYFCVFIAFSKLWQSAKIMPQIKPLGIYENLLMFLIISVIIYAELNFLSRGNLQNFETKREIKIMVQTVLCRYFISRTQLFLCRLVSFYPCNW